MAASLVPPWLTWLGAIGWRVLVSILLGIVVLALAAILSTVTASVLVALIVASTFAPYTQALRNRGWSPLKAAAVVTLLAVLVIGIAAVLIVLAFVPYAGDVIQRVSAGVDSLKSVLADLHLPPEVATTLTTIESTIETWVTDELLAVVSSVATIGTIAMLALFLTFFLLKDGDRAWDWSVRGATDWRRETLSSAGRQALRRVGGYLWGTAIISGIRALSDALFLMILGVPLVGPLSVLVFFGGFIPYIGGILATTVILLVTLATVGSQAAIILLVLIGIVNVLMRTLLTPVIYRRTVDIHPALVILALPAGAALAGMIGLFAVIPVLAFLMTIAPAVVRVLGEPAPEGEESPSGAPVWLDRVAQWSWRVLVVLAFAAVAITVVAAVPLVVIPLIFGLTLAATLAPAVVRLRQRGSSPTRAALVATGVTALVVTFVILASVIALAGPAIEAVQSAVDGAGSIGAPTGETTGILSKLAGELGSGILGFMSSIVAGTAAFLVGTVFAVLLTFYFLRDGDQVWDQVTRRMAGLKRTEIDVAGRSAVRVLGGYMIATGTLGLFNAVTGFVIMTLLGLPLAFPIALLSFFGQFIPYIGQFVTSMLGFGVAVAAGTTQDVVIMGIYTIIMNLVQGSFLQPIVYGRAVNIHPALVLIAIPAGSQLAGIIGMFLAVPVLGVISTTWRHVIAALNDEAGGPASDAGPIPPPHATSLVSDPASQTPSEPLPGPLAT